MQSTWRQAIQEKFDTLKKVEQVGRERGGCGLQNQATFLKIAFVHIWHVCTCGGVAFVCIRDNDQGGLLTISLIIILKLLPCFDSYF